MRSSGATELQPARLRLNPDGEFVRSGQIGNSAAADLGIKAPERRRQAPWSRCCPRPFAKLRFFSSGSLRTGIAALLIAHLLVVAAMAASPGIHEWLHHDADHDDHDCAVTLFLSGGVHSAAPLVILSVWIPCFAGNLPDPIFRAPALPLTWSGILEHAPPAVPAIG